MSTDSQEKRLIVEFAGQRHAFEIPEGVGVENLTVWVENPLVLELRDLLCKTADRAVELPREFDADPRQDTEPRRIEVAKQPIGGNH